MVIFIDESGIEKSIGHSVFVLVYVCVENIEKLEKAIEEIEKNLKIERFHWADFGSNYGWKIRENFIKKVSFLSFNFKFAVIDNPIYLPKTFEDLLRYFIVEKNIKKIVIDGKKPKWYQRDLKKILRDKGISVRKIRTMHDESSPTLRLADGLAGLIRSYYDKPTERVEKLYSLFENKITAHKVSGQSVQ